MAVFRILQGLFSGKFREEMVVFEEWSVRGWGVRGMGCLRKGVFDEGDCEWNDHGLLQTEISDDYLRLIIVVRGYWRCNRLGNLRLNSN